ncbi:hypothetical protein EHI8A_037670 [Entamoeba histolytica HM-1:IMSS-B]|uniref:Uncharacterized protein n=5 Tax=Entamoeba histolytica TaxID=5759 RepID=C4LWL1_ENTH1|nr:hypothetical protein EHI_069230 [Entamoeba histolytica HM-1:IMSS]EMH74182.1 hypothetical protein EHI8A_037670 [Entamoeba histolytica HM-1:IMSS-B]EMS14102.1 hypothetical protein KM1_062340 [Entamoeba histolytica HM-3:IMSS]ENY62729.1 hypothetical protein EHI7A_028110 [Entamoeba histolytica HM-1:IMSS-A]GAT93100.1 hypothetical protein CL6EHI_069230 [Entamoeba histolytica]EAL49919.1 hypothetical protein EHI_069230 [Entamoeba histolytica HM-1:IMSS]|eukprot:XP_655308.1 hypothetical protein EHI_069230 [Entamoeba histolytica HM-1:IMSS]
MILFLFITLIFASPICDQNGTCSNENNEEQLKINTKWDSIINIMKNVLGQMWKHIKTEGIPIEYTWKEVNTFLNEDWIGKKIKGLMILSPEMSDIFQSLNEAQSQQLKGETTHLLEQLTKIENSLKEWKQMIGKEGAANEFFDDSKNVHNFVSNGLQQIKPEKTVKDFVSSLGMKWLSWVLKKSVIKKRQQQKTKNN